MIAFVTTTAGRHTLDDYLAGLGREQRERVTVWTYQQLERLWTAGTLPHGTIVFADIERLDAATVERATEIWQALQAAPERWRTLNHPRRTLRRLALLEQLYANGTNDFRAWPAKHAPPDDVRFPVFLRVADDHAGPRSELLHDRAALARAVANAPAEGWIACEYRPVTDADGAFVKYGAFIVAGAILPRHVMFARDWVVKVNVLMTIDMVHATWVYFATNPHAEALADIARQAGVDYGRIDYVPLPDGRLRVWEINTNPQLCSLLTLEDGVRRPMHDAWHDCFSVCLDRLDADPTTRVVPTVLDRVAWRLLRRLNEASLNERRGWRLVSLLSPELALRLFPDHPSVKPAIASTQR